MLDNLTLTVLSLSLWPMMQEIFNNSFKVLKVLMIEKGMSAMSSGSFGGSIKTFRLISRSNHLVDQMHRV